MARGWQESAGNASPLGLCRSAARCGLAAAAGSNCSCWELRCSLRWPERGRDSGAWCLLGAPESRGYHPASRGYGSLAVLGLRGLLSWEPLLGLEEAKNGCIEQRGASGAGAGALGTCAIAFHHRELGGFPVVCFWSFPAAVYSPKELSLYSVCFFFSKCFLLHRLSLKLL